MNLGKFIVDQIDKWLKWPQLPLYLIGSIVVVIVIAVAIDFLQELCTNNKANPLDPFQMRIHFLCDMNMGGRRRRITWNREILLHGMVDSWSMSETTSIQQSSTKMTQPTIGLRDFIPYKYLCETTYAARRPIH